VFGRPRASTAPPSPDGIIGCKAAALGEVWVTGRWSTWGSLGRLVASTAPPPLSRPDLVVVRRRRWHDRGEALA
jgi:hypothetical protein